MLRKYKHQLLVFMSEMRRHRASFVPTFNYLIRLSERRRRRPGILFFHKMNVLVVVVELFEN